MWIAVGIGLAFLALALLVALKTRGKKEAERKPGDILGAEGIITESVDNETAEGRIRIDGMDWKAAHVREDRVLEKGAVARVTGISGNRLLVESTGVFLEVEE